MHKVQRQGIAGVLQQIYYYISLLLVRDITDLQ